MSTYFERRMAEIKASPNLVNHRTVAYEPEKVRPAMPAPVPAFEPSRLGHIYFARAGDHVKIGFAVDITSRIRTLRTGNVAKITVEESFASFIEAERMLHKHFKKDRVRGEWFKITFEMKELWEDIWDYQGIHTATGSTQPGSGKDRLERMPEHFIPLEHIAKILEYSGKPWPEGLFADA